MDENSRSTSADSELADSPALSSVAVAMPWASTSSRQCCRLMFIAWSSVSLVAPRGKSQRQGARPDIDGRRLAHRRHQNLDAVVLGGFGQGGIARQAGDRPGFAAITDADIRRVQAVADALHRLVEQQIDAGLETTHLVHRGRYIAMAVQDRFDVQPGAQRVGRPAQA